MADTVSVECRDRAGGDDRHGLRIDREFEDELFLVQGNHDLANKAAGPDILAQRIARLPQNVLEPEQASHPSIVYVADQLAQRGLTRSQCLTELRRWLGVDVVRRRSGGDCPRTRAM
jgi:hypothetical protein